MIIGTIVDALAVIVGGLIGLIFHKKIPNRLRSVIFHGIGLSIIVFGIQMAIEGTNLLIILFSVVLGGIVGELLNIEDKMGCISQKLSKNIKKKAFTEGIITMFLLCCIGSMTLLGAIEEGLNNNHSLLLAKAVLDFFTAITFSATHGIGIIFAAIPLVIIQGGISLLASLFQNIPETMITHLTSVGGILLMGVGFNLLEIKKLKMANFLPSLLFIVLLILLFP